MELGKYANLGFEITKFGAHSSAIRFEHKPFFVFNPNSSIDFTFLTRICEIHLKLLEKRRNLTHIKT
jgi:hypothetical protein